jgi:FlaA1/EpsC-like NDP-sugar epimerase
MKKNLIIIGAGNVGAFIAYNLNLFKGNYNLMGFLDDDVTKHGLTIAGCPVLGSVADIGNYPAETAIAVGIASPLIRKRIVEVIRQNHLEFPNFIAENNEKKKDKNSFCFCFWCLFWRVFWSCPTWAPGW